MKVKVVDNVTFVAALTLNNIGTVKVTNIGDTKSLHVFLTRNKVSKAELLHLNCVSGQLGRTMQLINPAPGFQLLLGASNVREEFVHGLLLFPGDKLLVYISMIGGPAWICVDIE